MVCGMGGGVPVLGAGGKRSPRGGDPLLTSPFQGEGPCGLNLPHVLATVMQRWSFPLKGGGQEGVCLPGALILT